VLLVDVATTALYSVYFARCKQFANLQLAGRIKSI